MTERNWRRGRGRGFTCKIVLLLVACQAWSGAAYYNSRRSWKTKEEDLKEAENGWKASLVKTQHWRNSVSDLNGVERMNRIVASSIARAKGLDAKVRGAASGFAQASGTGRKLHKSNSFESPVSEISDGGGEYNMAFSLGTPPQSFEAIADTGSDLVWIQCAPCVTASSQCYLNATPGAFSPTMSSTYALVGCTGVCNALGTSLAQCSPVCMYDYFYGSGETAGYFSMDICSVNTIQGTTVKIPEFQFGCSTASILAFSEDNITDGIVGLGRGPISFPSQISTYLGQAKMFSYCLVPESLNEILNTTATSPIIFGAAAAKPANASAVFSYTPLLTPQNISVLPYYYANLTGIFVDGKDLNIPASAFEVDKLGEGGTIFDSGTSVTALTTEAYIRVLNAYLVALDYPLVNPAEVFTGLDLCFNVTGYSKVSESVPRLTFQFADAAFHLPFNNTFAILEGLQFETSPNGSFTFTTVQVMCLVLQQASINIFGNFQQQNFQVIYDQENLRLGWLPADCSTA